MSIEDRIASDQPDSFAFSKENEAEIKRIIAKYPKGRHIHPDSFHQTLFYLDF